ncbi:MAG: RNA-guided pseudouridylation complex pseudouridine synthase subunit Cbf5 [Candidatus Woesearchaeota archaeon]|jgi:H/ACA ribonucleoprotein complex subunit 4|nr:RNA-guided pseudouridylation complex pseudouridine synthase subunit Cbf5 [Candidatus Woesearchaeota archaeon]MDP6265321.1 RNA-guided pseudouridylation complex pseudouridine synthase subunit Cbf5 [Candidatus Woesearchaeota archaeon]MDP7323008.1 RNA-guided pseudouridylation complex pseudouridine synthase subunit Cbf5 [Candidatus Woesearchaeota archaeon]MDP7476468.1 RNA-guided pseudouridylation complex pseudouridine synthase subunit Cbf5 [Candidatus Woesearchaeota archaeon]HJO01301.1 RNA-guided|tara:strand:+ start:916 stop:1905 length:990 start_codon:yes stop_codon:yes gene_type:complete
MTQHLLPFEMLKRKILMKKEAKTDAKLGCKPEDRATKEIINYGVVNINKCQGPTSHQVSDYVQKILHINKSGHSGTLDPHVHGVLPVALGRATRIVQMLLTSGKEYVGIMHLHKDVGQEKLKEAIKRNFTGKIKQIPPLKSSVKRVKREREIYYFDILEKQGQDVLFIVGCQAGTYIRKLIHDLGQKLKIGAHMLELRRTKAGPFNEETLFTLQDLTDAYYFYKKESNDKFLRKIIQPIENAIAHLPKIWVFDTTVDTLCHGADLNIPGISKLSDSIFENDAVAIMTLKNELIALGTAALNSDDILKKKKGMAIKTEKVFMKAETYKIV